MADPARRPIDDTTQPPGVEGEGLDPYPTYRDGPSVPHRATASKPTDVAIPRSQRTYAFPMLIGLVVFGIIVLVYLTFALFEMVRTTDEALSPGDPAAPAASSTAAPETAPPEAAADSGPGFDTDVELDTRAGPGEVGETPGAIDVPGGATTEPTDSSPGQ